MLTQTYTLQRIWIEMHAFTEEQQLEIDGLPKKAVAYANKKMQESLNAHKVINSPFKWLMATANSWVEENKNNPKQGKSKSSNSVPSDRTKATVIDHEAVRDTLNDRKDRLRMKAEAMGIDIHAGWTLGELELLINGYEVLPLTRNNTVRVETNSAQLGESPLQWASKVEPILHQFVLDKNPGLTITRGIADKYWDKLTTVEQATIMAFAHPDCECRSGSPTIASLSEVVTKPHDVKPVITELNMAQWKKQAEENNKTQKRETVADNITFMESLASDGPPLGHDESNIDFDYAYDASYN